MDPRNRETPVRFARIFKSIYSNIPTETLRLLNGGSRFAVAMSGGVDSAVLFHFLVNGGFEGEFIPVHCDFGQGAVSTVTGQCGITDAEPIFVQQEDFSKQGCYLCARERRKNLFMAALKAGAAGVITGHHGDDIVESLMMSIFFGGEIYAPKPVSRFFKNSMLSVKPFYFTPKKEIRMYAQAHGIKAIENRCSQGETVLG